MNARKRNLLVVLMVFALVFAFCLPSRAADYPTKTITFVIPYAAGGFTDLLSRALANSIKKDLGQPVVCENKAGGGGIVGLSYITTRPADGYTIGLITPGMYLAYHMKKSDLKPVKGPYLYIPYQRRNDRDCCKGRLTLQNP